MTSIEEVVVICRNNGKAFYNGIDIFSKENADEYLIFSNDSEVVKDDLLYINKTGNVIYKKYYFYDNLSDVRTFNYLIWKKTKDGDWDWYKSEEGNMELINIKDYIKKHKNIINNINIDELVTKIDITLTEYNISNDKNKKIIEFIKKIIK